MGNNDDNYEGKERKREVDDDEEQGEIASIKEEEGQGYLQQDDERGSLQQDEEQISLQQYDEENINQEEITTDAEELSTPRSNLYNLMRSLEDEKGTIRNQEAAIESDSVTRMSPPTRQLSTSNERRDLERQPPMNAATATTMVRNEKFSSPRQGNSREATSDETVSSQDSPEGSFTSRPGAYAIQGRASGERPQWSRPMGSRQSISSVSSAEEEKTELDQDPRPRINSSGAHTEMNSVSEFTAGENFNDEPIQAVIVADDKDLDIQLNKMLEENKMLSAKLQKAEEKVHAWERYKPSHRLKMSRWYLAAMFLVLLSVTIVLGVFISQKKTASEPTTNVSIFGSVWISLGEKILAELGDQRFGESVDLSAYGDYLAIGSSGMNEKTGQVEVRQYSGLAWRMVGKTITGTQSHEHFGRTVQISKHGKFLVAGGFGSESESVKGVVRAYEFNERDQEWEKVGSTIHGDNPGDHFGFSLSASDTGLSWIVGAANGKIEHHDGIATDAQSQGHLDGYAKVYNLVGNEWIQKGSTIYGTNGELCGYAVAMSGDGNTVCVGDRWYQVPNVGKRGRARCFGWKIKKDGHFDWSQIGTDITGNYDGGEMGYSLSLNYDGDRVAVGDRSGGNDNQGSVSAFQFSDDEWNIMGLEQISSRSRDQGGFKVSLNAAGDVLAWTLRGFNSDEHDTGIVRIARWVDNTWERLGNDLIGDKENTFFGESVALDDEGKILVASANSGTVEYVRAFTLTS